MSQASNTWADEAYAKAKQAILAGQRKQSDFKEKLYFIYYSS